MKCVIGIAVLALVFPGAQAQESAEGGENSSRSSETRTANEPGLSAPAEQELSRAERRALRRSEQGAASAVAETRVATEEDAAAEDDEGLICRREIVTGTHRRIRVCTTAAEREAMRESSRDVLRDISRSRAPLGPEG
jgi:hypothetical protein